MQPLQPMACPQCGAPVQLPPGQPTYTCPYCHRQFVAPVQHQQPQQQQGQGPTFIIVHGPGGYDDDDDDDDDDYDYDHHHHHVAAHVVASSVSWITWVIVSVVITVLAGGGAAFAWFSKHSSIASSLVWDGSGPFNCTGNDHVNVKGVTAQFNAGTAITVGGNCQFTCTDCTIKAPTAIEAGGNGQVTIVNGSIIGTEVLVDASANARVNISGNVTASGEVKKGGNSKVSAPKSTAPAASAAPASPVAATPAGAAAAASAPVAKAAPKATAKPVPKKK
jgi:hypothetical protein